MLSIDTHNNITLTRWDTLTLALSLTKDGEVYVPEETDSIRFALSKGYLGDVAYDLKAEKSVPLDTLTFTLSSNDTKLDYGEYNYDVEVTHDDGCVDTFISAKLKIIGEVK